MIISELLNSHFAEALISALIHSLWQGVVIVSVLVIAEQGGLLKTPQQKYLGYLNALIILGLSTLGTFGYVYSMLGHSAHTMTYSGMIPVDISFDGADGADTGLIVGWQQIMLILYILGVITFAMIHSAGYLRLVQVVRNAAPAPKKWLDVLDELKDRAHLDRFVRLVSTADASVPFVVGVFRPVIVFPANYFAQLTPREVEAILVHELAHIGRNDFLLNLIQVVIESMLFFNPATWWLSREIRRQREFCCDDKVWNTHSRRTYLEALYKVAHLSTYGSAQSVALFQNNSELIMRVKRMSTKESRGLNLKSIGFATVGLMTVLCLFAFNTIDHDTNSTALVNETTAMPEWYDLDKSIDLSLLAKEIKSVEVLERMAHHYVENYAAVDTHPPSPRMKELQAQIEAKAEEIEELAEEMEEVMEESVEVEIEKIEEIAEQIEEIAEKYEEEIENEFENSPELARIEELSELMEEHMQEMEGEMEKLNEELISELEEKMEAKAEEFEDYNELSEADQKKLSEEMLALNEEMNTIMAEVHKAQAELSTNAEFQQMQEELATLSRQLGEKQVDMQPMQQEIQVLQEEMSKHQQILHEKMQAGMAEIQQELQLRQAEMLELQQQLAEEVRKWKAQHDEH